MRHAWTVICDRSSVDVDSNALTLHALERIQVEYTPIDSPDPVDLTISHVLDVPLEVVSLWVPDSSTGESGVARIEIVAPSGRILGAMPLVLELASENLRTRARLKAFPSEGPGLYLFKVYFTPSGGVESVVASIPLRVEYRLK